MHLSTNVLKTQAQKHTPVSLSAINEQYISFLIHLFFAIHE
ncbi:hypothetical protein ECMP0215613_5351 [Escherichia coli MP021561.3]|nr:hypothetical protein ECMP0215613_5351 [Escherichia coli MP021561.3]